MDFSGIGMMIFACLFVWLAAPILASVGFVIIFAARKAQGRSLNPPQIAWLIPLLYSLSSIVCCLFIYFSYLCFMYVM